jgi:hypothetical protein
MSATARVNAIVTVTSTSAMTGFAVVTVSTGDRHDVAIPRTRKRRRKVYNDVSRRITGGESYVAPTEVAWNDAGVWPHTLLRNTPTNTPTVDWLVVPTRKGIACPEQIVGDQPSMIVELSGHGTYGVPVRHFTVEYSNE